MSRITFAEKGWEDYLYWQKQDKKTLKKINRLLKSIIREGAESGEGKPELLKYSKGEYSRRIDSENRLVYFMENEQVVVISCRGHYED